MDDDKPLPEDAFDFAYDDFCREGYDELATGTLQAEEQLKLLYKLVVGRHHNQQVCGRWFTQQEVAARLGGLSQSYVSQIENGLTALAEDIAEYATAAGLIVRFDVRSAVDGTVIDLKEMGLDHQMAPDPPMIFDPSDAVKPKRSHRPKLPKLPKHPEAPGRSEAGAAPERPTMAV